MLSRPVDAIRSRRELVLENAVLRHQVNVLRRRSKRPKLHLFDRLKLLVGARWPCTTRSARRTESPSRLAVPRERGLREPRAWSPTPW